MDQPLSIKCDANGQVFITGYFKSRMLMIGSDTLVNMDTSGVYQEVFIAKYDLNGSYLWAKSAAGTKDDIAYGLTIDSYGNAFITGYFASTSITFDTLTLTNNGYGLIFITKYNPQGNVMFVNKEGDLYGNTGYATATDENDRLILTGVFGPPSITFSSTILSNPATTQVTSDIFVAKQGGVLTNQQGIFSSASTQVYPNPANDILYVNGNRDVRLNQVKLFDSIGREIDLRNRLAMSSSVNAPSTQLQVQTSGLVHGIYFIKIDDKMFKFVHH